jgi:hypothetical protein
MKQINVEFQIGDRAVFIDGKYIKSCSVQSVVVNADNTISYKVAAMGNEKQIDESHLFHNLDEITEVINSKKAVFDINKNMMIDLFRPAPAPAEEEQAISDENASPAASTSTEE